MHAFEVATIAPSGPASPPISIQRFPGGRLVTSNTPLPMLVQWAYQLDEGRLLGVPSGLGSLRFVTALCEQLGFRLVAQRTATEVVVIDHVERTPTEN